MLIDWFTVGAQALNFLILVWLLKRFLYRPVLDAIDTREKAIAATVADAASKELKARDQQAEFARKNSEFDAQRAKLLAEATAQAQAERARLLETVRAEADMQRSKLQGALEADYEQLRADIARRTRDEVLAIARKTLSELADVTLEQKMCDLFMQRLRALDGADKATLLAAVKAAGDQALCRTSCALTAQQQGALSAALDEVCASKNTLAFDTSTGLISGIELDAHGYKLAWNIDDYLASLSESIGKAVHERAARGAAELARTDTEHGPASTRAVDSPAGDTAPGGPAPGTPAAAP